MSDSSYRFTSSDEDTCSGTTTSEYEDQTDDSIKDEIDPLFCDQFQTEFDKSFLQKTRILEENYENKMNLIESNYKLTVGRFDRIQDMKKEDLKKETLLKKTILKQKLISKLLEQQRQLESNYRKNNVKKIEKKDVRRLPTRQPKKDLNELETQKFFLNYRLSRKEIKEEIQKLDIMMSLSGK